MHSNLKYIKKQCIGNHFGSFAKYVLYIIYSIVTITIGSSSLFAQAIQPFDVNKSVNQQYKIGKKDTVLTRQLIDTVILHLKKSPEQAISAFKELLEIAIEQQFDFGAFNSYSNIITIYNNKGKYETAFELMKQTKSTSKFSKLPQFEIAVLNSFGNYYQRNGQYDSASAYYFEALAIAENTVNINPSLIPAIYGNLSGIFEHTGEYEKGYAYLSKAEPAIRASGNTYYLTLILINKGNVLLKMGNSKASISPLKEAVTLAQKNNYSQWLHLALSDIAQSYFQLNEYKTALKYLKNAEAVNGDIDPVYQTSNMSVMGDIYFASGNYKSAETYWQKTLASATQLKISKSILYANKMLGELYRQTQQFELAYMHSKAYSTLRDSVFRDEVLARNSQLDKKYQTAQKDKEIAENKLVIDRKQHQIQNRNQWIVIVTTAILFLAMLTAFLYSRFINSKNKQKVQEQQLQQIEREQEILQLKSMIKGEERTRLQISRNLHDGIGGQMASLTMQLSHIKSKYQNGFEIKSDMEQLSSMLRDTAKEVRQSAHNLMPEMLAKRSLKDVLLHYCESNSREQFKLELQYDEGIVLKKNAELFIYRIVQELVQNIMKHAHASHAVIQLMANDDVLALTVEDNGVGFSNLQNNNSGQGLNSIRNRVENLNGFISSDSAPQMGTTILIELNFSKLQQLSE